MAKTKKSSGRTKAKQVASSSSSSNVSPSSSSSSGSESSSSDSDPGTLNPTPDPIKDEYGLTVVADPGESIDQEKIDHAGYMKLFEHVPKYGWVMLTTLAYEHEREVKSKFMAGCSKRDWSAASDSVLLTMEPLVLEEITKRYGNLNQLIANDTAMKAAVDLLEMRSDSVDHPAIYVRALTHDATDAFKPFTVAEAYAIAENARAYASDLTDHNKSTYNNIGYIIDRAYSDGWKKKKSMKGHRFFLQTKKDGGNDKQRARQLKTFARVLESTAAECEARKEPTVPVMHYVGYAINSKKRSQQHTAGGTHSSWLTQCIVAIAKGLKITTFIQSYTVALIDEETAGPVAEMLITRLARAYYFAGGFSLGQAGASMTSIHNDKLNEQEFEDWWNDNQAFIKRLPGHDQRKKMQLQLRKAFHESEVMKEHSIKKDFYDAFKKDIREMKEEYQDAMALMGDGDSRSWIFELAGKEAKECEENQKYIEEMESAMVLQD